MDSYGLTCLAEPVNIQALCARLSLQSLTHVVLIQDLLIHGGGPEAINLLTTFKEPNVTRRAAFSRFSMFRSEPGRIQNQMSEFKNLFQNDTETRKI